jgi:hypothetical protein
MKDRFSLHVHDGQDEILEALTVLRNAEQRHRGLVGITNSKRDENEDPIVPSTIFNTQSIGESNIRLATLDKTRSNIELLGNGNVKASGLHISYDPTLDDSVINGPAGVDVGATDSTVVDFSLLKASGCEGVEVGFMSVSELGFVGIGSPKWRDETGQTRMFLANSPLTIWHSGTCNSGTIAMKEQSCDPDTSSTFGKVYVKTGSKCNVPTQSLYFRNDDGNIFNLSHPSGSVFTDGLQNTFAGIEAPKSVSECGSNIKLLADTTFGFQAGRDLDSGDFNTLLGAMAGKSLVSENSNTIVGAYSFTSPRGSSNTIIGYRNAHGGSEVAKDFNILIGTGLYQDATELEDFTLAIGFGDAPLIEGSLGGSNGRVFGVKSFGADTASISLDASVHRTVITQSVESLGSNPRQHHLFDFKDDLNTLQSKARASFRFTNKLGGSQTLVDFDPSGTIDGLSADFALADPLRPFVAISGDLRLLGSIRFGNGDVIDGLGDLNISAGSGLIARKTPSSTFFDLDFANLYDSDNYVSILEGIDTQTSYLAVDLNNSQHISRMSIQALSDYVGSGFASVSNNCNHIWSNAEADIPKDKNQSVVFIGCDVATQATGWKHTVMIGSEAGRYATTPNVGLATDTASVFLGYRAGYDCDSIENSIFIGANAGKNADQSSDSIYIGSSAGINASQPNSIGIGEHALRGEVSLDPVFEGGRANIEIVTGLDHDERLMYSSGQLSNRLNIQNTIAGACHTEGLISIGKARLQPEAPLEVRRSDIIDGHKNKPNIQTWFNNDIGQSRLDTSGDLITHITHKGDGVRIENESWWGHFEGLMDEYIDAPSDYSNPTSGLMSIKTLDGLATSTKIWVTNRDARLSIHGPGADGGTAFVITARVNGENRPMYVSCSGT